MNKLHVDETKGYTGLANLGNTCFLNSIKEMRRSRWKVIRYQCLLRQRVMNLKETFIEG